MTLLPIAPASPEPAFGVLGCILYLASPASKKASKLRCLRFSVLKTGFSTRTSKSSRSLLDSFCSLEADLPNLPSGRCSLGRSREVFEVVGLLVVGDGSGGKSMGDIGRPQPGPSLGMVGGVGGSRNMLGLRSRAECAVAPVG